jgi:hypothetical protein
MKLNSLALNIFLLCAAEAALRGQKESKRSLETTDSNSTSSRNGHNCPEGYTQKHGGKFYLSEQDYLIVSLHLHFDTYLFSNEYITIL